MLQHREKHKSQQNVKSLTKIEWFQQFSELDRISHGADVVGQSVPGGGTRMWDFSPTNRSKFCLWCEMLNTLLCYLAVLDLRVGHTTDVLSPFISVLCHSDWLFHSYFAFPFRIELHWPCITDFSGLSTYGLMGHGLRKRAENPAYTLLTDVLFFSRPWSKSRPHHGRTLSVCLCLLSFWLTLSWGVLSTRRIFLIFCHHRGVKTRFFILSLCWDILQSTAQLSL